MARQGMDVDAVTSDGNQMKDVGATGIPTVVSNVESIISQMQANWFGHDAEAFVSEWNSTFKPNLNAIASDVATHGALAVNNATEQSTTSSPTSVA